MAHEIAHVAARHGTKNATKGEIAQLATIPADPAGPRRLGRLRAVRGLELRDPHFVPEIFAATTSAKPTI